MTSSDTLMQSIMRLAQLKHASIDRVAVQDAVAAGTHADPRKQLSTVTHYLQLRSARWIKKADSSAMPILLHDPSKGWGVLRGKNAQGLWISEWWQQNEQQWFEEAYDDLSSCSLAALKLSTPFIMGNSPAYQLIRQELASRKKLLIEAALGGVVINTAALATAFYTLQVYDRVVPTGASQTLMVLTLGVLGAILYELFAKKVRSRLYDRLIDYVDQRLAHSIYTRFLSIRIDQLPKSVGGLAAQMRGYETVRSFLSSVTTHLMVDAPYALVFVLVIGFITGWLALIPLSFFIFSVAIGLYYRSRVNVLAADANTASNFKTGLLVETVEGAEAIKAGQGGWRMLTRWMSTTDEARSYELQMKRISEHSQYLIAAFQQGSYILLVASGALLISKGELTMGGLIACSILSGRVMAPVAMISNQLVQWAHTKAALQGLDALWELQDDHHGQDQPIIPGTIQGGYCFANVSAEYEGNVAFAVADMYIRPGEKIGVLGPVGSGKTTLLRLLSGMYKPQSGRVFLDNIDLAHISKPVLAEHIGYVQQEGRLFAGTLRENLILGMLDPGDEVIMKAAQQTGLLLSVVMPHPKGLQQPIYEGGSGLSGGQRQLVNLTRAVLRNPNIWLLDEPTASMDRNLEIQVTNALRQNIKDDHTLVLVTHKAEMLELVDRIIVIANHRIIADGPKNEVLKKLQAPKKAPKQARRELA